MGCGVGDPPNAKKTAVLKEKNSNKYAIGILLKLKYSEGDSTHPQSKEVGRGPPELVQHFRL
jgi:hypothetical protein